MSSTTESQKSQTPPADIKISPKPNEKRPDPGSNAEKTYATEDISRLFREAREFNDKMTPEEQEKRYPWLKNYKGVGATASELQDLFDEV